MEKIDVFQKFGRRGKCVKYYLYDKIMCSIIIHRCPLFLEMLFGCNEMLLKR